MRLSELKWEKGKSIYLEAIVRDANKIYVVFGPPHDGTFSPLVVMYVVRSFDDYEEDLRIETHLELACWLADKTACDPPTNKQD